MKEIQIVEALEATWPKIAKDRVYTLSRDGLTFVWFATEHESLKLFLATVIGKRKGLKEQVIVIDSSQTVVADRLHLSATDTLDGRILPLPQMRKEVRSAVYPVDAVVCNMENMSCVIRTQPEQFFREATLPRLGLVSISIDTFSGGAWGTSR